MTLWFVRGIRRGVVTTRYPARPDPSAAHLPTPPAFRPRELSARSGEFELATTDRSVLIKRIPLRGEAR